MTGSASARRQVEDARDRDVQGPAAPLEHARELAEAAVGDGEGAAVVADRDRDESAAVDPRQGLEVGRGLRQRAQERKRFEIDADDLETRLAAGIGVAIDEVAVGDDEQDAARRLTPSPSTDSEITW